MEHLEAKEMHAAEKYVLGELSEQLREEYEEHYLDCSECAGDVRAAVSFVANSKEVFEEESQPAAAFPEASLRKPRGWAGWLRPLVAVPAIAALIVALVYEKHHTDISVPASNGAEQTMVATSSFGLRGGDRESSESTSIRIHSGETFGLHFDFTPGQTFEQYTGELQDQAGQGLRQFPIPAERINKEVKLVVPGGVTSPGNYGLVVYGTPPGQGPAARILVARYLFSIEFVP
jgi:hypothetical protein